MIAASSKRKVTIIVVGILLLAGASWAIVARHREAPAVPDEFTIQSLQASANQDPGKMFEAAHQAMQRPDLSDQQRHAVWENVRALMEVQMDKRMDAYFTAEPAQRQAILDEHLDEMQVRMKQWQQRRAERERAGEGGSSGRSGPGDRGNNGRIASGNRAGSPQAGPPHGGPHQHTPQERKIRSESRDPDKSARRMAYFSAMRQRAEQRGIQMPFGRGPGH